MGRIGRVSGVLATGVLLVLLTGCQAESGLVVVNGLSEDIEVFVQYPGEQPKLIADLRPNLEVEWTGDGAHRLFDLPRECDSTGTRLVVTGLETKRQFLLNGPLCANRDWRVMDYPLPPLPSLPSRPPLPTPTLTGSPR